MDPGSAEVAGRRGSGPEHRVLGVRITFPTTCIACRPVTPAAQSRPARHPPPCVRADRCRSLQLAAARRNPLNRLGVPDDPLVRCVAERARAGRSGRANPAARSSPRIEFANIRRLSRLSGEPSGRRSERATKRPKKKGRRSPGGPSFRSICPTRSESDRVEESTTRRLAVSRLSRRARIAALV